MTVSYRLLTAVVLLSVSACGDNGAQARRDGPAASETVAADQRATLLQESSYREAMGAAACTKDCSGHEAGWRWAIKHRLEAEAQCPAKPRSFSEGCIAYTDQLRRVGGP